MRETILFFLQRLRSSQKSGSVTGPIIRIATASVALGMVVMIIAAATGIGLQEAIRNKVSDLSGHIQITAYKDSDGQTTPPFLLSEAIEEDLLEAHPNLIKSVEPYGTLAGIAKSKKEFEGIVFKGLDSDFSNYSNYLIRGNIPAQADSLPYEIMVSEYLANRLQIDLGEKIAIYINSGSRSKPRVRTFKLVGIFETGMDFMDESLVVGKLAGLRKLNLWQEEEIGGLEIRLHNPNQMEEAEILLHQKTSFLVKAESIERKYPQVFQWIELFDLNILVVLIIMILVAGINMITTLLILMIERTPMIGTLKALGAEKKFIRVLFLNQGMSLLARGMIWGNLIGLGLILIQHQFELIKLDPGTYYVDHVPISFPWFWFFGINLGTGIITLIMLWIPSGYISKIQPVKAIRFE